MTNKAHCERAGTIIIKTRQLKHFHKVKFLRDLKQKAWSNVQTPNDPNDMWLLWRVSIGLTVSLRSKRFQ